MIVNKILFFTHYSSLYGANKSLLLLLDGLREHEVELLVIVPDHGDICKILEKKGIPYKVFKFYWWCGVEPAKSKTLFTSINFNIKEQVDKRRYRIFNISRLKKLKEKLGGFEPDYVYSNSSVFNFGFLFAKKYDIPHLWHLRETQEQYDLNWWYSLKYIKGNFQQSEIVIGVSEYIKQIYAQKYGIQEIKVLYNPILSNKDLINIDKQLQEKRPIKEKELIFGIIGLLHPHKGQEDAIRALAIVTDKYPDTGLIIAGMGDQTRLKSIAIELKVFDNIEFWGHIEDPFEAFLNIDVSLMCSRMEAMGRVTLESMAASVPVIGYKEGGTLELINDKFNGLFYQESYKDLAEKMIFMIENDSERKQMEKNARESFGKEYTMEIYAKNFIDILENFKKN